MQKCGSTHIDDRNQGPDQTSALAQYRRRASVYDAELALLEPVRRTAIARLELRDGDVVLDAGCGTGLSFAQLRRGIGGNGKIIGIEQSPDMIGKARARIKQNHWSRITVLNAPVETAKIRGKADAALFHFTHDILLRPDAVANVVKHLKPGARVVASGLKWAGVWAMPVNVLVWLAARHSTTSIAGLRQPWQGLAGQIGPMQVETMWGNGIYVATGRIAGHT